jgi:hypothetical protein
VEGSGLIVIKGTYHGILVKGMRKMNEELTAVSE